MSFEQNKAVVVRFGKAMDEQDWAVLDTHPGLAEHMPFYQYLFAAFPDLRGKSETMVAEGDWVTERLTVSGTQKGEFLGIAPTGRKASWEVIAMYRLADGKIVKHRAQGDVTGIQRQLGAQPTQPAPAAR